MDIVKTTPICNVALLSNVPLDSSYSDTLTFGSLSAQVQYFAGKTAHSWANMTPTRLNVLRVPLNAEDVYKCNYVMFQNTNFGNKWFFCFITGIHYVNAGMTEITLEIDVLQTWYFDYTLKPCHVLREHVDSDKVGEHILPEPVTLGDYVLEQGQKDSGLTSLRAVIQYAKDSGVGDGMCGGLFSGLNYMSTPLTPSGSGAMLDLLQSLVNSNRNDSVVATFIMPDAFYTTDSDPVRKNITVPRNNTTLGGYTPRNKKLLTYPYNMLMVDNLAGEQHMYRYEWFSNLTSCIFEESCGMGVNPEVVLAPRSYNGQTVNYSESMSLSGWPQFAYVIDTYRAWASKNQKTYDLERLKQGAGIFSQAAAGNLIGATMSGFEMLAGQKDLANAADTANASQANSTLTAIGEKTFYFFQRHVQESFAAAIDDFFDRYGYNVDSLKVPNRTGRPSWNYVKTDGCVATGNIPLEDITKIKSNYDKGITFWHGTVGDYSANNAI